MRRARRLVLRLLWWQALMVAPLALMKFALSAAGLTRVAAEADEVRLASLFDGLELKSTATAFRGGAIAWFSGGLVLDLREASIAEGGADLALVTVMGGSVIRVPGDWSIELEQRSILGGAESPQPAARPGPALRINALTVMGGLSILQPPAE